VLFSSDHQILQTNKGQVTKLLAMTKKKEPLHAALVTLLSLTLLMLSSASATNEMLHHFLCGGEDNSIGGVIPHLLNAHAHAHHFDDESHQMLISHERLHGNLHNSKDAVGTDLHCNGSVEQRQTMIPEYLDGLLKAEHQYDDLLEDSCDGKCERRALQSCVTVLTWANFMNAINSNRIGGVSDVIFCPFDITSLGGLGQLNLSLGMVTTITCGAYALGSCSFSFSGYKFILFTGAELNVIGTGFWFKGPGRSIRSQGTVLIDGATFTR